MELNINSPAYYTSQFGVIDEIYTMCREISEYVKNNKYSELIDIVGITPIIAPKELINQGLFKENKKCEIKYGFASVSLQINYDLFIKASIDEQKKMIIENIIVSVKSISRKSRIDIEQFIQDVKKYCEKANINL